MLGASVKYFVWTILIRLPEYVDHLHEHFVYPCSINSKGHYNVPTHEKEGYRYALQTFIHSGDPERLLRVPQHTDA